MPTTITTLSQIAIKIIKEQALIIGPLAWGEARKVPGLDIKNEEEVSFSDVDQKDVINKLVAQYEKLFGRLSHEISKEAVQDLLAELPASEIPSSLI